MDFDPNVLGNIGGAILVGGYGAFRLINLLRGKDREEEPKRPEAPEQGPVAPAVACPDPECKEQLTGEIQELKEDFKKFKADIFPKINRTAEGVARIEGWIEGMKNSGKW